MKKIKINDIFTQILYLCTLIILLSIFIGNHPKNSTYASTWYVKSIILGIYFLCLFFNSLKEKITSFAYDNEKIIIINKKLFKKQTTIINKNDIQNCTMFIYKEKITLKFIMQDRNILSFNNNIVTPLLIEKISKISDFINNFDYIVCKADFPKRAEVYESIIKKDNNIILREKIFTAIIIFAFIIITMIIALCSIY